MIIQAKNKKEFAVESKPVLRVMSTGIKLTNAILKTLDAKAGDKINYASDDATGKLYICKTTEGSTLGENKTFTNTGFKGILIGLAKGRKIEGTDEVVKATTEIKAGTQLQFIVADSPVEEGGVKYFELTFDKASKVAKKGKAPAAKVPVTSDFE